jgi:hypothetical protein
VEAVETKTAPAGLTAVKPAAIVVAKAAETPTTTGSTATRPQVEAVETRTALAGLTAFKPAETVAGRKKNRGQLRPGSRTLCKPVRFPLWKRSPKGLRFYLSDRLVQLGQPCSDAKPMRL